ncbi:ABC transporter ATP-binding protein [Sulfitobacter sp. LCG007]
MSVSHLYQQFDEFDATARDASVMHADAIEDEKLASFEAGYQAGWDDAIKAQTDERARMSSDFAQNLQEMSFSYHEAITKLSATMQPLLQEIVEKLLPTLARATLGAHVLEQLNEMLGRHAEGPIEIVVAQSNIEAVRGIVDGEFPEPFELSCEPGLGESQAFVRIGATERQVDLDAVIAGISQAMQAVFDAQGRGTET